MPYIVPKELPKSCYDCPFSCVLESHPYWSGEKDKKGTKTLYCQVDAERRELTTDFYDKSAKADWCPLVDAADVERLQHKYELAVAEREANVKGFTETISSAKTEVAAEILNEIYREANEEINHYGIRVKCVELGKKYGVIVNGSRKS